MSVIDKVQHYQRSIEKCWDDEERMMHCISKLYQLPITVQHLRDTGVGRTVNSLRKYDGGVGDAAKALVAKWKTMVANEDSSDAEDEDEACVPDAPESYSDNPESPKRDENSENGLGRTQESKERSKKSSKSSSSHGSKHSPKGNSETDSKSREKHSGKERQKSAKDEEQREKSRKHTKHDSDSDSRKSLKDDAKRESRDSREKRDDGKVSSSTESVITNGNDSRKRKQERIGEKKESTKKAKYSESESEEENSRLVINSPSESESIGIELGSLDSETKKSSQSCDKSSRKEGHKDRKKERDDSSRKSSSRSEEKESQKKDDKSNKEDKRKKESHKHSSSSKSKSSSHSSSRSSSKDSTKPSDNTEEEKSKRAEKSRSEVKDSKEKDKDKEKDQKVKKKVKKEKDEDVVGIDSQSGTSFADALGMCMLPPPPSRKKGVNVVSTSSSSSSSSSTTSKSSKSEPEASTSESSSTSSSSKSVGFLTKFKTEDTDLESNPPSLLAPNVKLEPLSVDLAATLPEISPNYKPLTYNMNPVNRKFEEDRSLSEVIYSKNQRTKVFSGNKTGYSTVPSLYEMCIRVLIENIDALEVTGGVPFYILKPVLERATPDQLYMLEHHNPYLVEETDPLWQFHCNREFRTKKREEMESWREMYMRCLDEREAKLKALTANIKQSIDKSTPVRSTIQVNDNFHVKPPRSVLRKQAKYGTAKDLPVTSSELKRKLISGVAKAPATTNSCSPTPIPRLKATSSSIGKKTKAPLMAKALQLIKGRYRR